MGLGGIETFAGQGSIDAATPGHALPSVPGGSPAMIPWPACDGCSNQGTHKGGAGCTITGATSYIRKKFAEDCLNANAERVRQLQAAVQLLGLCYAGIPAWTDEQYQIGGNNVWVSLGPYPITGGSARDDGYAIQCTYEEATDPATVLGVAAVGVGWLTLNNSKLGGHLGFPIYAMTMTAPSGGTGTVWWYTPKVPSGSRWLARVDAEEPVTATITMWRPGAQESYMPAEDVTFYFGSQATWTLGSAPAAEAIVMIAAGTVAPAGAPWTRVEQYASGSWSAWDVAHLVKNVPNAGGDGYKVVLDLTGVSVTGITDVRVHHAAEWGFAADLLLDTYENEGSMVQQVYDLWTDVAWDPIGQVYFVVYKYAGTWQEEVGEWVWDEELQEDVWTVTQEAGWVNPEWSVWAEVEPTVTGDDVTLDLSSYDFEAEGIEDFKVEAWMHYLNDAEVVVPCQDRCAHASRDYTLSVGVADGAGRKWHCALRGARSAGELAFFDALLGRCLNQACAGWALREHSNPYLALRDLVDGAPFAHEQSEPGTGPYTLTRQSHHSLRSLAEGWAPGVNAGVRFAGKVFDLASGGYPRITFPEEELMAAEGGLEFLEDGSFGPGGGLAARKTNYAGETATADNDAGQGFRASITRGVTGVHRYDGAQAGQLGRCVRYEDAWVLFPGVNLESTEWQINGDCRLRIGSWDAAGAVVASAPAATLCVHVDRAVRPIKMGAARVLASVASVRPASVVSRGASYQLALRHGTSTVGKAGGTGEDDTEISVTMGGSLVLPEYAARVTNWACPENLDGGGDGTRYLQAGHCLVVPSGAAVPAQLRGRLLPVASAIAADEAAAVVDPDWAAQGAAGVWSGVEGVDTERAQYCDTIVVIDEGGTLAALEAADVDLEDLTFGVVEAARCAGDMTGYKSADGQTSVGLTLVLALPSTGMYFFEGGPDETRSCFAGLVKQAVLQSVPSAAEDLNTLGQAMDAIVTGVAPA